MNTTESKQLTARIAHLGQEIDQLIFAAVAYGDESEAHTFDKSMRLFISTADGPEGLITYVEMSMPDHAEESAAWMVSGLADTYGLGDEIVSLYLASLEEGEL